MAIRLFILVLTFAGMASSQSLPIAPGVPHELAKWRAARYSDVRYKLNLTLEKMSPVLKGTIEISVKVEASGDKSSRPYEGGVDAALGGRGGSLIVLDWRKIRGSENLSAISNVSINDRRVENHPVAEAATPLLRKEGSPETELTYAERDEHLIFRDGVLPGENVIKLDFTSPILTSGSAITRYVDKDDGAEYIYSLFVPSDASTAFPVFDQPDLKARFTLDLKVDKGWKVVSNSTQARWTRYECVVGQFCADGYGFEETKPISTYVFAFAAGPFERQSEPPAVAGGLTRPTTNSTENKATSSTTNSTNANAQPPATAGGSDLYIRKSQAAKFQPHAAEVFRLNREGIKFLESYFDYKFPFPKYDIVLIPEFPFGGMEHAGATFLRESSIIFPQEPTKNDYISRANLIFHEAAHQWFGDTVTMKWFDDLWLKEGFAEFMAYKTLEKVMPEVNAWKVFFERNKQAAYLTDSTKGTTPIYQEIANLNSAKSAYGNIVYRKAPSFLKQAEFYLGPDKFQTAVRAFLKKHEYANAGWEDLVKEFETAGWQVYLKDFAKRWVTQPGVPVIKIGYKGNVTEWTNTATSHRSLFSAKFKSQSKVNTFWLQKVNVLIKMGDSTWRKGKPDKSVEVAELGIGVSYNPGHNIDKNGENVELFATKEFIFDESEILAIIPNYQDYGYGIFLLDDKSRDYVLKNIHNEKDDFLRTMMWGSLWDSVREGELDPKEYVELVIKVLSSDARSPGFSRPTGGKRPPEGGTPSAGTPSETDESTVQTLLTRVSTALRYYMSEPGAIATGFRGAKNPVATAPGSDLTARVEDMLIDRMQNAPTPGLRITYYRAFLNMASSESARRIMKVILKGSVPGTVVTGLKDRQGTTTPKTKAPVATAPGTDKNRAVTAKDKFDIVSRLIILGDPEAPKLLADLEKTETSDEARRYTYAAKAGFATAENKAKYWNDFTANKDISESWIEAAFVTFNNVRHSELTLPYLEKALAELPNLKRSRKIFFVNGWLGAFIGGQKSEQALAIVNKFLADNPNLDKDLRLKILENVDLIERAVKIRTRWVR